MAAAAAAEEPALFASLAGKAKAYIRNHVEAHCTENELREHLQLAAGKQCAPFNSFKYRVKSCREKKLRLICKAPEDPSQVVPGTPETYPDIFCTAAWYDANPQLHQVPAAASTAAGSTAPGSGTAAAAAGLEQLGQAAGERTTTTATVQPPEKEAGRGHYQFTAARTAAETEAELSKISDVVRRVGSSMFRIDQYAHGTVAVTPRPESVFSGAVRHMLDPLDVIEPWFDEAKKKRITTAGDDPAPVVSMIQGEREFIDVGAVLGKPESVATLRKSARGARVVSTMTAVKTYFMGLAMIALIVQGWNAEAVSESLRGVDRGFRAHIWLRHKAGTKSQRRHFDTMTDYQFVGYGTHHSLPTLIMVDRNIVGFELAMERLTHAEREFNWAPGDAWGPDFGLQDTIETRVFCLAVEQALLASMEQAANDLVAPFPAVEVGALMAIEPLRFHAGPGVPVSATGPPERGGFFFTWSPPTPAGESPRPGYNGDTQWNPWNACVWLGALACYLNIVTIFAVDEPWKYLSCPNGKKEHDTRQSIEAWATRLQGGRPPTAAETAELRAAVVRELVEEQGLFSNPGRLGNLPASS